MLVKNEPGPSPKASEPITPCPPDPSPSAGSLFQNEPTPEINFNDSSTGESSGVKERETKLRPDGSIECERTYDPETGKETSHTEYLENGEINYKEVFEYSKDGLITKEVQTDGNGEVQNITDYIYNEDGTITVESRSADGSHDWTYQYDENGDETTRTHSMTKPDGTKEVITWDYTNDTKTTETYDAQGNLIE